MNCGGKTMNWSANFMNRTNILKRKFYHHVINFVFQYIICVIDKINSIQYERNHHNHNS